MQNYNRTISLDPPSSTSTGEVDNALAGLVHPLIHLVLIDYREFLPSLNSLDILNNVAILK
jgi:hypothetical protein